MNSWTWVGDARKLTADTAHVDASARERRSCISRWTARYGSVTSSDGRSRTAPVTPRSRTRRPMSTGSPSVMRYAISAAPATAAKTAPCPLESACRLKNSAASAQIAAAAAIQIGMQEGERERHPLDHREVQLRKPQEPRRREGEHDAREKGGAHAQTEPAVPAARRRRRTAHTRRAPPRSSPEPRCRSPTRPARKTSTRRSGSPSRPACGIAGNRCSRRTATAAARGARGHPRPASR